MGVSSKHRLTSVQCIIIKHRPLDTILVLVIIWVNLRKEEIPFSKKKKNNQKTCKITIRYMIQTFVLMAVEKKKECLKLRESVAEAKVLGSCSTTSIVLQLLSLKADQQD